MCLHGFAKSVPCACQTLHCAFLVCRLHSAAVSNPCITSLKYTFISHVHLSCLFHCEFSMQAHAPSLDCCGLVIPGRQVLMTRNEKSTGKTTHAVQLAYEIREHGQPEALICAHPKQAEKVVRS